MKKYASPINERIAYYRKKAGYTQAQIAEMLGIPSKTYSYREQRGKVSGEFVNTLARIFSVPAIYILDGETQPETIVPPAFKPIKVGQSTIADPAVSPAAKSTLKSTGQHIADLYDHLPRDLQFEVFDFVSEAFNRARERENNK